MDTTTQHQERLIIPPLWNKVKLVFLILFIAAFLWKIFVKSTKDIDMLYSLLDMVETAIDISFPLMIFILTRYLSVNYKINTNKLNLLLYSSTAIAALSALGYVMEFPEEFYTLIYILMFVRMVISIACGIQLNEIQNDVTGTISILRYSLIGYLVALLFILEMFDESIYLDIVNIGCYALPVVQIYHLITKAEEFNENINPLTPQNNEN